MGRTDGMVAAQSSDCGHAERSEASA